jgi:hypothetical protein
VILMMKPFLKSLVIGPAMSLVLASATTHAGPVTVPNTFVSGAPARADEVNANFNAVAGAVNDNDTRIDTNVSDISRNASDIATNASEIASNASGVAANASEIAANTSGVATNAAAIANITGAPRYVIVDSNGQIIGDIIGGGFTWPVIITSEGYVTELRSADGIVRPGSHVFFTEQGCTGDSYMDLGNDLDGTTTNQGYRLSTDWHGGVGGIYNLLPYNSGDTTVEYWYIPRGPTIVSNLPIQSVKVGVIDFNQNTITLACHDIVATIPTAVAAFANDPAVTGIANAPYAAPLAYERR